MHSPSAYLETFGCQMNEADTEKMAGILRERGYRIAASPEQADVIVLNTCSIRAKAEQKVFSRAGRLGRLKRGRPGTVLVVTGCVAQRLGAGLLERAPDVDAVVGTSRQALLPEILAQVRRGGGRAVDVSEQRAEHPAAPVRAGRVRAFVNVMHGCDNFCAYCIVPHVRGRERSRPPEQVVAEVAALGREGYREVTLLGQNVNSYGRGLEPGADFPGLLRALDARGGVARLRFTTSHPRDFSPDLVRAVRDLPAVCESVHLPLQAGSDGVLARMNRGYDYEAYRRTYFALREAVPEATVTSDIIVGFPGETAQEYGRTLAALEELRFDAIFSFRFSPREGTAAWGMDGHVAEEEKARRLIEVQELQKGITEARHGALVGRTLEVLVEGPSRREGTWTGRTRGNHIVNFPPGPGTRAGDLAPVRIVRGGYLALAGEVDGRR